MEKPDEAKLCEHPEELKGRPQDCTPEQIRKCHGPEATHLCLPPK